MLVTHLHIIAKIENDKFRKFVLKSFKEIESESLKNKDNYKTKLADVIATIAMIQDRQDKDLSEEEIFKIIQENIQRGKQENAKIKKRTKQEKGTNGKDVFGNKFESKFFKNISKLFENEPINELGLVTIFSLMFNSIQDIKFEWKNELISFSSIKLIRSAFPDAIIRCKNNKNLKQNFELEVEFEFESYNFIRHGHFNSPKKCDLIICWIDDSKTNYKFKDNETIKKMPPVFSLKDCFDTGKITIYN